MFLYRRTLFVVFTANLRVSNTRQVQGTCPSYPKVATKRAMLNNAMLLVMMYDYILEATKSQLICFKPCADSHCVPLCIGADWIEWFLSVKYLRVHFTPGRTIGVDISSAERTFVVCNGIYHQSKHTDEQLRLSIVGVLFPTSSYACDSGSVDDISRGVFHSCLKPSTQSLSS